QVVAFIGRHFFVFESEISLSSLPAPRAGLLEVAEFLRATGERLKDAYSVQRRSGFGEFRVMLECFGEVAKRLGRNRVNEVGHGGRKALAGYQPALRVRPTCRGLPTRARAS